MSKLTRRSFVAGASALPFALWLEGCNGNTGDSGGGQGPTPDPPDDLRIRYDARSPEGQAMLQIYRDAVGSMQNTIQEGDPSSWAFQWYIHGVKRSTNKAAEIARLYPNQGPHRDLAEATWNTCQAHYAGADENFFLPWHRMYIYYFESIVRAVSQESSFTLPYWNYSTSDLAIRGVLPEEFREQGSPLFIDRRNPGVNEGEAIQGSGHALLNLDALAQRRYKPRGAESGFNMALDFGLHGSIHVLTGGGTNMGSVPWAAGDPIFWIHHCNIDRLWASWNAAGRRNPTDSTWLDQGFTFADAAGQQVVARVREFNSTAQLGYAYDQLESVAAGRSGDAQLVPPEESMTVVATESAVALSTAPVRVRFGSSAGGQGLAASEAVESETRDLYLVIKGLAAQVQPEVVYNLYLNLPSDASAEASAEAQVPHLIGAVNFFGAVGHGEGGGHGGDAVETAVSEKFVSFKITDLVRRLKAAGALIGDSTLTISPVGEPVAAAHPVLGEVSLVEQ